MRYSILLLALLLYNAGHDCLATHANSQEAAKIAASTSTSTTPTTAATTATDSKNHSALPLSYTNNETVEDDGDDVAAAAEDVDDGGGGSGSGGVGINSNSSYSSIRSRNDTNRVHVYTGKIGGQQTASPTRPLNHKPNHTTTQLSSTSTTYVTKSTTTGTAAAAAAAGTAKADARRSETPFSTVSASIKTTLNNESNAALDEKSIQPAFVYKAAVPTHEEKNAVLAHSTNASSNDDINAENDNDNDNNNNDDKDNDDVSKQHDGVSSKKIIGSSVVTSVSVILNGDEPEFTDAIGTKIPKPQPSLQVASPIDLLNPDRYEFYTFDDNGELVKRLMTMQEIQSIVANGDGEGPTIIHKAPVDERDPEKNVQDIVNSVQTVLSTQAETSKNTTTETLPVLDTPDVSSSWSMILPAIFGNTGGDIFLQQKPSQILMEPDTEIVETSTNVLATNRTTKKPKPNKRKPGQKRKTSTTTTTTEMTPQVVQEELGPNESVYTGMEQYQNIASNAQSFEGIPELNLKPLFQQINDFSTKVETTTKRVFVNNQEVIQTAYSTPSNTEKGDLNEQFAKKPHGGSQKAPPHRQNSTKRPQVTHTKQKIKRKPSTTTSTTTSTSTTTTAAPETTSSTTASTTTSSTTAAPSAIPSTTILPLSTIDKKKKKKPTQQPFTHSTHKVVAQNETSLHYTKPHPQRRPSTSKPRPTVSPISNKKPTFAHDQAAESTIHHTTTNAFIHHKRPRPHKTTTTTSTTTSTTTTTTSTTTTTTPAPYTLATSTVAEDYPALPLEDYVSPNLLSQLQINDSKASSPTTTNQPSAYPIPSYGIKKPPFAISDLILESQLKKEKLPTLSMIQHHYKPSTMTEQSITPMTNDDLPAMLSFDQLMQSLKGDGNEQDIERLDLQVPQTLSTEKPIAPIKYDSAESMDELQEIANKKKKPIIMSTKIPDVNIKNSTEPSSSKYTTESPDMIHHYENSSTAALLAVDKEFQTDRSNVTDTKSKISTSKNSTSTQSEDNILPEATAMQQPLLTATTIVPNDFETTNSTKSEDFDTESTYAPAYSHLTQTTQQSSPLNYLPLDTVTYHGDQNHVVKFEPLYAEDTEPIVTELSTTASPTETTTDVFDQNEETTLTENLEEDTESQQSIETTEGETVFTTQEYLRLPVSAPQKDGNDESATAISYGVADLKPNLNMDVVKPTEQILMASFQTHAATVASILVDGANTESNDPKDELQFLMTDVLKQVADPPEEPSMNRLASFAHLNSSFLMKPSKPPSPLGDISSQNFENEAASIDVITELPFTSTGSYVENPENNNYQTNTETFPDLETTTFSPKHEALIDSEKELLTEQLNTTETPNFEHETTSFNIPILSLSETNAQQQQQDLDSEMEKKTSTEPSADIQATERDSAYGLNYQTGATDMTIEGNENDHTMHLQNQYEKFYQEQPGDKQSNEIKTATKDQQKLGNSSESNQQHYEENLNIKLIDNDDQHIDTTSEPPVTDSYIGEPTSKPNDFKQTFENPTDLKHTDEETNFESISDDNIEQTTQYVTEVGEKSEETTPVPPVPEEQMMESSESPHFDDTTFLSTMNTDSSDETLDDLIATMMDQTGLDPEEVYVKLGESTARPLDQKNSNSTNKKIIHESTEESSGESNTTKTIHEVPPISMTESHQSEETQIKEHISDLHDAEMKIPLKPENNEHNLQDDRFSTTSTSASTSTSTSTSASTSTSTPPSTSTTTPKPIISSTKRLNTLKPVSYYKQPSFGAIYNQPDPPKIYTYSTSSPQQRPMQRPAALSNLMASSTQATRPPVKLDPSPDYSKGLEASVANLDEDVLAFSTFCNELAFNYWKLITSEKISSARSLVLSPFALTSMLSMVFLGARGGTSGEMNEVLKLDDVITFNPHLVFKNITDSVERSTNSDIATAAFVREIFSDRGNGKILQFFKDKTQQFYAGHVEEVNFHVVNDIIRRRTNLLIKRHTMGKVLEYLRTNSVWVNGPLATISANLFQTDCSKASTQDRDGEMFFQVHPTVRQRRLVPIPAVLYKSGFTAGYEPNLDATIVAFGRIQDTVSTIYVMPGHQSSISPTDNLERLQRDLVEKALKENAWSNLLTSLMDRPGMEVQLPRFSHRSFVNATLGLQKMGLKGLFKSDFANLRGLTGSSSRDIYLSDMIQINTFSTCGEERISDHHHVEMYPAPPLRKRNKDVDARGDDEFDSSETIIDFGSLVQEPVIGRGFYDDLLDPKFLELPLPLRPRQARVPDAPRLRFDKPFLYFVRHNPTGMILFMGRFNPRLLP